MGVLMYKGDQVGCGITRSIESSSVEIVAQKNSMHTDDSDSNITSTYTPTKSCWLLVYGFLGTQRNHSSQGLFEHTGEYEDIIILKDNVTRVSDGFGNTEYMALVKVNAGQTQTISQKPGSGNMFHYYEHRILRIVKLT